MGPVCRWAPLLGGRSVCSAAACRAMRHREGREQAWRKRDAQLVYLLREAARLVEEGRP
jgi:hypothetical protein